MIDHSTILLAALILDWLVGDPEVFWRRVPHPVAWMGWMIKWFERKLNLENTQSNVLRRRGAIAISLLLLLASGAGWLLQLTLDWPGGWLLEIIIVSIFLAQKSLHDHGADVANALHENGITQARKMVARMVGRDPQYLGRSDVSRATIESIAENFSDGVVAPAFWYLVFGLPGLVVYKIINTADSMVGYKSDQYRDYGRASAKLDDLANWLPARISAGIILIGATMSGLGDRVVNAIKIILRDARLHASPNAGWPESAMAGVCDIALGGPRNYGDRQVLQSHINSGARVDLDWRDIQSALQVFKFACISVWIISAIVILLF